MKAKRILLRLCLLGAMLLLPAAVQAQFTFTTNNGAITITGYYGPGGAVAIPNMISGSAVTEIGDDAFVCQPFTSITIPNSVIGIGYNAFSGCSLTNVAFGTDLTTVGNWAFDMTILSAITIPASVTNRARRAMYFSAIELIWLEADREWLEDAAKTIGQHWRLKNARRNVLAGDGQAHAPVTIR